MSKSAQTRVCIFGEVLFDHFPDGQAVLGGAPFNVAWHLQALKQSPYLISRVGEDEDGGRVRSAMEQWGMDTTGLQSDPQRATGQVRVSIIDGEPRYDIVEDCAYDAIEPAGLENCDFLYHGSLAARCDKSADALLQLRDTAPKTVFVDANLRQPWWRLERLEELLQGAHWIKLNGDELAELQGGNSKGAAQDFFARFKLQGLILTHGADGAEMFLADGYHARVESASNIEVVDTVGAGDGFASIMVLGLLEGWPMALTLQRAQVFAERIVARRGATVAEPQFYQNFREDWGLAVTAEST